MRHNILFLVFHGFSDVSGISKKIWAQVEGLRQGGHTVHVCWYGSDARGHKCRFVDGEVIEDYGGGRLAALRQRVSYDAILSYCQREGVDVVYVRSFHNANPWTIHLFGRLKQRGVKVVMEIPTYPYDQEYEHFGWADRMKLKVDQVYRQRLARQTAGIVTFSDADTIFGWRTMQISNGIDFDAVPLRRPASHPADEVHLLGVAEVHVWHGYDRLIRSLSPRRVMGKEVVFHIVGGVCDADRKEWDGYIRAHHLEENVVFHGALFGDELTRMFDLADFGIGSLARHRSGITRIKTLKNREYAARGIPFIYSEVDDDFERMPYIMKAAADESPIDIGAIVRFVEECRVRPAEIRASIAHLSWKRQMERVMEMLEES